MTNNKTVQVFMSHTKLDRKCCDNFDIAASRCGVIPFRSEFEKIEKPEWQTIKSAMNESSALFLLVGEELVKAQEASEQTMEKRGEWKFTQNWIAYEVGLACQRGNRCLGDLRLSVYEFPCPIPE